MLCSRRCSTVTSAQVRMRWLGKSGPRLSESRCQEQGSVSLSSRAKVRGIASQTKLIEQENFTDHLKRSQASENATLHRVRHDRNSLEISVDTGKTNEETVLFHAQWLFDAKCDRGPARTAATSFCQTAPSAKIERAWINKKDSNVLNTLHPSALTVGVEWTSGDISQIPLLWLRAMAPLVAHRRHRASRIRRVGWRATQVVIPEISYESLFGCNREDQSTKDLHDLSVLNLLLDEEGPGIIKVTGLPAPDVAAERAKERTLVTAVLKRLFGAVFSHPVRGDKTSFNVATHQSAEIARGATLPNYDTNQVLLPHSDHAHYHRPARVQGWYGLEGSSINTFVDSRAALATLVEEQPDLAHHLSRHPIAFGRVAHYYDPPMYQATAEPPVGLDPLAVDGMDGGGELRRRIRWHPHLAGALLAPFAEFEHARAAIYAFQEVMRRDDLQLSVNLQPGDMYVWDNYRVLHGRERVVEVPRTGIGQTVPEQVVMDRYRALLIRTLLSHVPEVWLVQTPTPQLRRMLDLL